jgi:hypothetical protein
MGKKFIASISTNNGSTYIWDKKKYWAHSLFVTPQLLSFRYAKKLVDNEMNRDSEVCKTEVIIESEFFKNNP